MLPIPHHRRRQGSRSCEDNDLKASAPKWERPTRSPRGATSGVASSIRDASSPCGVLCSTRFCLFSILWPVVALLLSGRNLDQRARQAITKTPRLFFTVDSSASIFLRPMGGVAPPSPPGGEIVELPQSPNYRGLDLTFLSDDDFSRRVAEDDDSVYKTLRKSILMFMDKNWTYDDVDDRDPQRYDPFDEQIHPDADGCYRLKWSYALYP